MLGENDELTHRCALELGICLLDQNLVVEAVQCLVYSYRRAERSLGGNHAICLEMRWCVARAEYRRHFFGEDDCRSRFISSFGMHMEVLRDSTNILGVRHPTTRGIRASLKLCFEEQLDWTLDDIPREILEDLGRIPRPPGTRLRVFPGWRE